MPSSKEQRLWNLNDELIAGVDKAPPGTFRFLSDILWIDTSRVDIGRWGISTRVDHLYTSREDNLGRSFVIADERKCKEGGCCVDFITHWTLKSGVTYNYHVHITEDNRVARVFHGAGGPSSAFGKFKMPRLDINRMLNVVTEYYSTYAPGLLKLIAS